MSAALTGRAPARKATPARVGLTTIRGRGGRPRRVQIITTAQWGDARIVEKHWSLRVCASVNESHPRERSCP